MSNRSVGNRGEQLGREYLARQGYHIVDVNFKAPGGEIDVIALRRGVLLFVEVKYRQSLSQGHPAEAITRQKLRRIRAAALAYLNDARCPQHDEIKFDALCILELVPGEVQIERFEDILGL